MSHMYEAAEWAAREAAEENEPYYGDARRCPAHPHVKTSSDDGMFDGLCWECEAFCDDPTGELIDESEEETERHPDDSYDDDSEYLETGTGWHHSDRERWGAD